MQLKETDIQWVLDRVIDEMLDRESLRKHDDDYVIEVFTSAESTRIVVCFRMQQVLLESLVLDVSLHKQLGECKEIIDCGNYLRLHCDLLRQEHIEYYLDAELTAEVMASLRP